MVLIGGVGDGSCWNSDDVVSNDDDDDGDDDVATVVSINPS